MWLNVAFFAKYLKLFDNKIKINLENVIRRKIFLLGSIHLR